MEHAVVGLPVSPPQSVPESQGLRSFVTLVNRHFAAAVQPRLQGTPARRPESEGGPEPDPARPADRFPARSYSLTRTILVTNQNPLCGI